jgi:hypothetical protein
VTDPRAQRWKLVFALSAAVAGCGVTHLQTARTTPAGETRTTVGATLIRNDLRTFALTDLPVELMIRHGVSPRTDFGVRLFFALGALADVKWSLLDPARKTALAISGGFGAAADPETSERTTTILHLPVTLTVSRDLTSWLTGYGAVGYGTFWILGRGYRDPTMTYPDRTVTGDGLLNLHVGVELSTSTGRAVMFEYGYLRPIVNDPGDFYAFTTNHLFSIAFRTGRGTGSPVLSR